MTISSWPTQLIPQVEKHQHVRLTQQSTVSDPSCLLVMRWDYISMELWPLTGPLSIPNLIMSEYGIEVEWYLKGENQRTQRKTYPSTTLSTEVPYGLTKVQAQGSTVRRWHLTTSTMAQPPHRGGPGSHPGQSMWDLWWTKWHWDRSFSEFFSFPVNIISLWLHTHISSGDKQKAC
jgi:hypothetical protein